MMIPLWNQVEGTTRLHVSQYSPERIVVNFSEVWSCMLLFSQSYAARAVLKRKREKSVETGCYSHESDEWVNKKKTTFTETFSKEQ